MTTSRAVRAAISAAQRTAHWRDGGRIALRPEPPRTPKREPRVYGPPAEAERVLAEQVAQAMARGMRRELDAASGRRGK